MTEIRKYRKEDETGWLQCRVLSFLDTAYYDSVLRKKEVYSNPSIELVACEDGKITGLIDVEYELSERTVCSKGTGLGGMIWHLAVHPDYRRKGIASLLLSVSESEAGKAGLNRFEAWTRDDDWVNRWYLSKGFKLTDSYLHVYAEGKDEIKSSFRSETEKLNLVNAFAHYTGNDRDSIRLKFKRVHDCFCYEKYFN